MEDTPELRWAARVWGWVTLTNAAPEADPVRTLSAAVVAISTAVLSYSTLRDLGHEMGLDDFASYLFPLGYDFATLAATRAWLHPKLSKPTNNYAAAVAILCLLATVIGNGVQHTRTGIKAGDDPLWIVTVIVFSSLAPLILGLTVHLLALIRRDIRDRVEKARPTGTRPGDTRPPDRPRPVRVKAEKPATEESAQEELPATGTDGAPAQLGEVRAQVAQAYQALVRENPTMRFGRGATPYTEVDRKRAEMTGQPVKFGYAKKIVPALEGERLGGETGGDED